MQIAIFGAGNGAFAAAAHMTLNGHQVTLANRSFNKIDFLASDPRLEITGGAFPSCTVNINRIAKTPIEAIKNADIIMICVPTTGHEYYAKEIAPVLSEDQIILLNPGHMGGALHFAHNLRKYGYSQKLNLFETHTLTYTCRLEAKNRIGIYNLCPNIMFASLPSGNKQYLRILELYPTLLLMPNVLYTSLSDHNAVLHPPGMLLNAARIQSTNGDFTFYIEGTSPAVADLIKALDDERLGIAKKLGLTLPSFLDAFYESNYTTKAAYESGSIYQALKESAPNKTIKCDPSLDSRYVHEDVGYGLVALTAIAKAIGVNTPIMDAFISLFCYINKTDYRVTGMTLEKLGLEGLSSVQSIIDKVERIF